MSCRILFISMAGLFLSSFAYGVPNFNEKVAKVDFGNSTIEDVVRIFGRPVSYNWDNKIYKKNNLPQTYLAIFHDNFRVMIRQQRVHEIRFESKDMGFRYLGQIGIGSTLDEAVNIIGPPKQVISGQMPKIAEDGILYKDIDGKTGRYYYSRPDKGIRCFFSNYKISGLYITSNLPYVRSKPASSAPDSNKTRQ